jgi:hypothetical protein
VLVAVVVLVVLLLLCLVLPRAIRRSNTRVHRINTGSRPDRTQGDPR